MRFCVIVSCCSATLRFSDPASPSSSGFSECSVAMSLLGISKHPVILRQEEFTGDVALYTRVIDVAASPE